jgi:ubiquitin-conjugating enzyme E2 J1
MTGHLASYRFSTSYPHILIHINIHNIPSQFKQLTRVPKREQNNMTSPSTRRLLKESTDLHKNPSPYFTANPITDDNLHDWHFTLVGPPSPSPYSQGLYHGRITFPPTYPLRPPSFRFLTPSGRFEVNREICLSISGHHEETWQPAWGVRTALLAIRSEIMGAESQGQVGGMEGSIAVRREFAKLSMDWVCRECGVGNLEAMQGWWGVCRDRGVEVDVETAGAKVEDGGGEGEKKAKEKQEENNEAPVQRESSAQAPAQDSALADDTPIAPSAPSLAAAVPATLPAPAPAPASSPRPAAAVAAAPTRTVPVRQIPLDQESPEGVWLDRAIVGVVIALVILILRRVSDVDDL